MAFMWGLCETIEPRRILVIGNSYGLSTVFLALANPKALVVAMDKFRTTGLQFTEMLCEGLNVNAIQASTPDQLHRVVSEYLHGGVDLVLVDAVHENEVQTAEFRILAPLLSESAAVVFHDVLSCDLLPSLRELKEEFPDYTFSVLPKTTSGLAVAFKSKVDSIADFLAYYQAEPRLVSDFQSLLTTSWGSHRANFFEGNERRLKFPPHPQT
jgi:predicted O-methyltransferase YrrM